jgi:hypothetical protein
VELWPADERSREEQITGDERSREEQITGDERLREEQKRKPVINEMTTRT